MKKTSLAAALACVILLALVFSFLPWKAEAGGRLAPGDFSKSTPINLSAYLSVWTLTLTWNPSAGASGYEYCVDKTSGSTCDSTSEPAWTSTGTNTSTEITNLDANTTYYWQVRAVSGGEYTEANAGTWWAFTTGGYARFHVRLVENSIAGYDWRPGNSVSVAVDDPSNGAGTDFSATKNVDSNGTVLFYNLGSLKLGTGMNVTMNDGVVFKSHVVTSLQMTGVVINSDVVSGTGKPGDFLNIQHCQYNGCLWRRWATVQPNGTWQVNFSVKGTRPDEQEILDIVPGTTGTALWPDPDGDHTDVNWYTATRIGALPEWERIQGWGWPLGATVSVTINDPATPANPDYANSIPVIVAPYDASLTFFDLGFSGLYNLKPGDVVTATDGKTTKVHTVTGLQIAIANAGTDVVSGRAASGSFVDLQTCGVGGCTYRTEQANGQDKWWANFAVVGDQPWEQTTFDFLPSAIGDSRQWDADADATIISWIGKVNLYLPMTRR